MINNLNSKATPLRIGLPERLSQRSAILFIAGTSVALWCVIVSIILGMV